MFATAEVRLLPRNNFSHITTRLDREFGVYWAFMQCRPRACFTHELLVELRQYLDVIIDSHANPIPDLDQRVRYGVLASKGRGIFNLGGDLQFFRSCIDNRDRDALVKYGTA